MVSEKNFLSISHYKSMAANESRGVANLDPRGIVGRVYVGNHLSLLHTKYVSSGPNYFTDEEFWIFFHYKSMGANVTLGAWLAGFMNENT